MASSERTTLTQPAEWWEAFKRQAYMERKSLSEWAGEAMLSQLPARAAKKLPPRNTVGAPKKIS